MANFQKGNKVLLELRTLLIFLATTVFSVGFESTSHSGVILIADNSSYTFDNSGGELANASYDLTYTPASLVGNGSAVLFVNATAGALRIPLSMSHSSSQMSKRSHFQFHFMHFKMWALQMRSLNSLVLQFPFIL